MLTPGAVESLQWSGANGSAPGFSQHVGKERAGNGSIWQLCGCSPGRLAGGGYRHARGGGRSRLSKMAGGTLAAGAGARRLAPDLRCGDARARARSDAARSRSAGPAGRAAARPGRIRADAGRLHQGGQHRAPRRAGKEARRRSTPARSPRSSSNSACPATCCWRSGAARPRSAATGCRRTPSPCSPPRAITAGARTCLRRSCSTPSRCWRRATSSSRI